MKRIFLLLSGFGLGFAIVALTIAALVFFGLGVGGHFLVTNDEGVARIISYDPSTVAAKAPLPAAMALLLMAGFAVTYVRLKGSDRRAESDSNRK